MLNVYISTNRFHPTTYVAIVDTISDGRLGATIAIEKLKHLKCLNIGGLPWLIFVSKSVLYYKFLYQANSIEEAKAMLFDLYPEYFI